jgi:Raf kinase inhibitor-like YbhB/YbcL family protein
MTHPDRRIARPGDRDAEPTSPTNEVPSVLRSHPVKPTTIAVAVLLALTACDTGDGTTLKAPSTPTTLAPIDTSPLESVAIEPADTPAPQLPAPDPVDAPAVAPTGSFQLFAPWADGGPIDSRYSCDGSNVSPSFSWADVPDGTAELAVAFVDETNLSNGQPFIHWIMAGIDASQNTTSIGEGQVPVGATQALNFFGDIAFAGPCPNPGETNTYRLTLFALNQQLEVADGTPATELLDLINTVAVGTTSVTGTHTR